MVNLLLKSIGIIFITLISVGLFWLVMMAISYNPSFISIPLFVLIGYWLYLNKR